MTLPAATLTTPARNTGGQPVITWTLPSGAVQTGYQIGIYRQDDIIVDGPAYWPVGGTRDGNIAYSLRDEIVLWEFDRQARSFTANDAPPSSRSLSNGDYRAIMRWRGSVPGGGRIDDQSFPATADFSVSGSSHRDVPRVPVDRVYALPAPVIVYPTEGQIVTLADDGDDMHFDFDIQRAYNPYQMKAGIYRESFVDDAGEASHRPLVGTDDKDGDGWTTGAEWIPISDLDRIPGAATGWQRYRITFNDQNKVSGRVPVGLFAFRVRYNSDGGNLRSLGDQVLFELRNSDAAIPPDVPVSPQTSGRNPIVVVRRASLRPVNEDDPFMLEWRYLSGTGLKQKTRFIRRERRTSPSNATSVSEAMFWTATHQFDRFGPVGQADASSDNRVTITNNGTGIRDRWGKCDYAFEGTDHRRYHTYGISVSDLDDNLNANPAILDVYVYASLVMASTVLQVNGLPLNRRYPRSGDNLGVLRVFGTVTCPNYPADVRLSGNRPERMKFGVYRADDIVGGVPVAPPVAYTSDYKDDPVYGNRSRRHGQSDTGAEWIVADTTIDPSNRLFNIAVGLRFGDDLYYGGDPLTQTFGGLAGNGDYVARGQVEDRWGNASVSFQSSTVTVNLPEPQIVDCAPRVFDENDVAQPAGAEASQGVIPGVYIGMGFTERSEPGKGLPSHIQIQRREFSHPNRDPDTTPITFPQRLRITQSGVYPTFRDYTCETGVQYEYRTMSIRNPGITAFSPWTP